MSQPPQPIVDIVYLPVDYQGPYPPALPACTDLLPWEEKQRQLQIKEDQRKRAEQEYLEKKQREQAKGTWATFLAKAEEAAFQVGQGLDSGVDKLKTDVELTIENSQRERFLKQTHFTAPERLWFEYCCSVISGGKAYSGYLYVTGNFLSFFCLTNNQRLQFQISFSTVMSIQRAVALPIRQPGPPFIQIILNPIVQTDAFLIYTADNKVHMFYKFRSYHDPISDLHDHAFNVIDHAWRSNGTTLEK
eukprot:TRINITY_DN102_c0_g1_i2.p1 TRINITY_DN102_c0_g1~~TRINITY_DN102_c0_g1_i2.p1  ORF type:complete len:247 (-),score=56.92 TRINITY_DN102_c0_g1_i2:89-829(-)